MFQDLEETRFKFNARSANCTPREIITFPSRRKKISNHCPYLDIVSIRHGREIQRRRAVSINRYVYVPLLLWKKNRRRLFFLARFLIHRSNDRDSACSIDYFSPRGPISRCIVVHQSPVVRCPIIVNDAHRRRTDSVL